MILGILNTSIIYLFLELIIIYKIKYYIEFYIEIIFTNKKTN